MIGPIVVHVAGPWMNTIPTYLFATVRDSGVEQDPHIIGRASVPMLPVEVVTMGSISSNAEMFRDDDKLLYFSQHEQC